VFAEEVSSTTASSTDSGFFSNIIENVNDLREGVKEQFQDEEKNAVLEKRTQERITNLAANISNRFDGIIARLQNIIDRLSKRIEKQESLGYDVQAAKDSLSASTMALDEARTQMDDIDEAVRDALGSTDPRGEWRNVRTKYLTARESIRKAHTELRNTIINLKNAQKQTTEPTSTSTTTTQ
jgi:hypothetical protein